MLIERHSGLRCMRHWKAGFWYVRGRSKSKDFQVFPKVLESNLLMHIVETLAACQMIESKLSDSLKHLAFFRLKAAPWA